MDGRLKRVVSPNSNPRASWSLPDVQAVEVKALISKKHLAYKNIYAYKNCPKKQDFDKF